MYSYIFRCRESYGLRRLKTSICETIFEVLRCDTPSMQSNCIYIRQIKATQGRSHQMFSEEAPPRQSMIALAW